MKQMLLFAWFVVTIQTLQAQVPTITSFSPASGQVGTLVTITGANFSPVPANNTVYFGAVKASITSASPTAVTVTVPAGATYQPISVTVNNLTGYSNQPFIVTFSNNCFGFTPNSFAPKVDYDAGSLPTSLGIGDFDGDGKPDLAVANIRSYDISVYKNIGQSGNVAFADKIDFSTKATVYPFTGSSSPVLGLAISDIDGDGKLDITVANRCFSSVAVFRNTSTSGTISFAPAEEFIVGTLPQFVPKCGPACLEGSLPAETTFSDLDGDGKPDLAVLNTKGGLSIRKNISTIGTIAFAPYVEYPAFSGSNALAVGDLDGDGKPDLAIAGPSFFFVFKNTSTNNSISLSPRMDFDITGIERFDSYDLAIGDLDGDGRPDLALTRTISVTDESFVSVFKNTSSIGSISLALQVDFEIRGNSPSSVAINDLDGDGRPDLAVTNKSANTFSVLRNLNTNGVIDFSPPIDYATGTAPSSVAIGDLNGDGKPDLAVANSSSDNISVLKNQNCLVSTCTPPTFLTTQPIVGNATCGNNDGQISIIPQSGNAPYMYSLDGGATYTTGPHAGVTQFNLAAGSYQLRLKDANGCESEIVTRTIETTGCPPTTCTPPTFLNTQPIVGHATCGNNDGQISIIPTSGTGPFMYSFDGGATYVSGPNAGLTRFSIAAGTYQLRLKDASGCESAVITREVRTIGCPTCTPPTLLNTRPIVGDATCNQSDGQISIIPTSGTGSFMYSINGGSTYVAGPNAGYTFFNLPAGTYQLRLKAGIGCESDVVERTVQSINCPPSPTSITGANKDFVSNENSINSKLKVSAYPNPSKGQFKLQVLQSTASKAEVFINDGKGTLVQQATINPAKGSTINVNLSGKAKGMYYVKVVTKQGITTSKILLQ